MSRVHDTGGQTGFGPVPAGEDGEPAFAADWEARVYALAAVLRQKKGDGEVGGLFNDDPAGTGALGEDQLAALVTRNGLIGTALV